MSEKRTLFSSLRSRALIGPIPICSGLKTLARSCLKRFSLRYMAECIPFSTFHHGDRVGKPSGYEQCCAAFESMSSSEGCLANLDRFAFLAALALSCSSRSDFRFRPFSTPTTPSGCICLFACALRRRRTSRPSSYAQGPCRRPDEDLA